MPPSETPDRHGAQTAPGSVPLRVAYVVKVYPRFSETFIVNEILAHEEAGLSLEIFALRPTSDTHFQDTLSRVRSPVSYIKSDGVKAADFWTELRRADARGWAAMVANAQHADERDVYQALVLARLARERRIGHFHAHFASTSCTVTRLAATLAGVSYTFTAHAKDIFHESVVPDDVRAKLRDAAGAVTVSEYNVRYIVEHFGADPARLRRIYNGMDLRHLRYESPQDRPRKIIAVGRLVEKKGFVHLVDACAVLARRGVDFACEIAGEGPLKADLTAQVRRLGLESRVTLVGPRPQRDVLAAVQAAAVFAAPCVQGADGNRDGLPTVLLESMALGTPAVSTDVTGIPEAVRHGQTGLIVPQGSTEELADALARLLDDAALRATLASGARRLIEQEFDIRRNTAALRDMFAAARASSDAPSGRRDQEGG